MSMLEDIAEQLPDLHKELISDTVKFYLKDPELYCKRAIEEQEKLREGWLEHGLRTPFNDVVFLLSDVITLICHCDDEANNIDVQVIFVQRNEPLLIPHTFHLNTRDITMEVSSHDTVAYGDVSKSIRDKIDTVIYTFIAVILDLGNMWTEYIEEPTRLNKKRIKNGKQPIQAYHVLKLGKRVVKKSIAHGNKHSSPAMHSRRGHFRRYQSGKVGWVRPAIVGKKEHGMVLKDYSM